MIKKTLILVLFSSAVIAVYKSIDDAKWNSSKPKETTTENPITSEYVRPLLLNRIVEAPDNAIPHLPAIKTDDVELLLLTLHNSYLDNFLGERQLEEALYKEYYSDERWFYFYQQLGFEDNEISQLLELRRMYLGDVSQVGKKYGYLRWSKAPHIILTEMVVYEYREYLVNEGSDSNDLVHAKDSVASSYGISSNLVDEISSKFFEPVKRRIELTKQLLIDK